MSEYSKGKLYRITHRLYKELRNDPDILVTKMRSFCGEYDYGTDVIKLDFRKEIIPTLIHEYLHKWNPNACETWVLQEERKIINALSEKQVIRIIVEFANAMATRD